MSTQDYTFMYGQSPTGSWGAYVKGVQGSCVATGQTREECERRIREAIPLRQQAAQVPSQGTSSARRQRTGTR